MSEDKTLPHAWAEASCNEHGIYLVTRSGFRMSAIDENGSRHFLSLDAPNSQLGLELCRCTQNGRVVAKEEWDSFFDWKDTNRRFKEWEEWQMAQSGVKTLKALRANLMVCSIRIYGETLVIHPSIHAKINEWPEYKNQAEMDVVIPFNSPSADIGAALREAFKRCSGLGRDQLTFPEPLQD